MIIIIAIIFSFKLNFNLYKYIFFSILQFLKWCYILDSSLSDEIRNKSQVLQNKFTTILEESEQWKIYIKVL